MLKLRLMPIGDLLRWLARAGKRARAKSGGLKRYPDLAQLLSLRPKAVGGRRERPPGFAKVLAAAARQRQREVWGWKLAEARNHSASALEPNACLAHCPPPSRPRPRASGGGRRRHGSVKRCAGCSRARNCSALGARAARNTCPARPSHAVGPLRARGRRGRHTQRNQSTRPPQWTGP